jgi:hypothetical protein
VTSFHTASSDSGSGALAMNCLKSSSSCSMALWLDLYCLPAWSGHGGRRGGEGMRQRGLTHGSLLLDDDTNNLVSFTYKSYPNRSIFD